MLDELLEKIKKMDYKDRVKLLDAKEMVNKLFLLDGSYDPWLFKGVASLYEAKDLLKVFTKDIIDKISLKYQYREFIFLETLKEKNAMEFEIALIHNADLMEFLLTKGMYIRLNFSYDFLIEIINFIDKNNIVYDKSCLFSILHTSLKDKELQKKFLNEDISSKYKSKMLTVFDDSLVNNYINSNYKNISNKDLYSAIMYKSIEVNPIIYENKDFFKDCIVKNTLYETRIDLDRLANIIDISYFEKILQQEEIKLLTSYNKELDSINYQDSLLINYLNKNKKLETKKFLLEIVIDYLFQDCSHNVYLNLVELLDYSLNNNLLSKNRLEFYKELLLIYKSDSTKIINFFNKYKDKFEYSYFYDDIRLLKNDSYLHLKDSCLKIDDITNLQNIKLSNKYNLDIYELNGEKFNMLVSCTNKIPNGYIEAPRNCYTYIGENNMQVIYKNSLIYGYLDFNIDNIMHVYEDDAYSLDLEKNTTSYVNRIRNKDELLNTNYRSEIQIKNAKINNNLYKQLLPAYIICFNEINEKSIEAARELEIPIIIINKEKYQTSEEKNNLINYEEEYTLLPYMTSSALEKYANRGKKKN